MANKHLHFIVGGGNTVFNPKFGLTWPYILPAGYEICRSFRWHSVWGGQPNLHEVVQCFVSVLLWWMLFMAWLVTETSDYENMREKKTDSSDKEQPRGEKGKNPTRKTKRQKRMNKIYAEFLDMFFTQLFLGQYFGKCIQVSGLHWLCYLVSTCLCLERLFCFDSLNCSGKEAIL